ncbi:hypothetical protein ILUMI_24979 [Ignelater luminosus]|uniref:Reverse transcriptase domain-containing protein n=1 Tax=Ignelater luminosus TaxID=2038154 RepID=A0A8K0C5E7_IGNLU|nr:hypothetical protein ILUMI_24979 [Ignelater luminosus]
METKVQNNRDTNSRDHVIQVVMVQDYDDLIYDNNNNNKVEVSPDDLNDFFCTVAEKITSSIPSGHNKNISNLAYHTQNFFLGPTDVPEVRQTIMSIQNKSAAGLDNKSAVVTPIFKTGDYIKELVKEYNKTQTDIESLQFSGISAASIEALEEETNKERTKIENQYYDILAKIKSLLLKYNLSSLSQEERLKQAHKYKMCQNCLRVNRGKSHNGRTLLDQCSEVNIITIALNKKLKLIPRKIYRLTTVTYGTKPASFLATRVLKQLAIETEPNHPLASKVINNDFYVDDMLTGCNSIKQAILIRDKVTNILASGGFNLCKWASNNSQLLPQNADKSAIIDPDKNGDIKVLGFYWNCKNDKLKFKVDVPTTSVNQRVTKRNILATSAKIFDPLGLINPAVVKAKIFMQGI